MAKYRLEKKQTSLGNIMKHTGSINSYGDWRNGESENLQIETKIAVDKGDWSEFAEFSRGEFKPVYTELMTKEEILLLN